MINCISLFIFLFLYKGFCFVETYDIQIHEDQQMTVVFELEVLITVHLRADMWNSCQVKDYIYLIVH